MNKRRPNTDCACAATRIVMLGAAVPADVLDAVMKSDPIPQIQTHKLSWALIRGLESTGAVVDLISTVPVQDYPRSNRIWFGYRKWDRGNGSDNRLVPFVNVLGLKQLTRFLGAAAGLVRWSVAHRGKRRHVLLYGLFSAHLYAVRCVKRWFPTETTVLITDLPGLVTFGEPWWRRVLRPLDRAIVQRAVQAADGVVVLVRQIAEEYAPGVPAMVMEGMVSVESEELAKTAPPPAPTGTGFSVLYAGLLEPSYGIPLLLGAFSEFQDEEFHLWLLGRGEMEEHIRRLADEDARIHFPGLVTPAEAFRRCQAATVLVNPRPTSAAFARYSFPSKLLEYMATGRPVITTRLPGIPPEYGSYVIWLDRETPEGLAELLRQLRARPPEELNTLGLRARDFVLQEKSCQPQGRRIVEFMEHVQPRRAAPPQGARELKH